MELLIDELPWAVATGQHIGELRSICRPVKVRYVLMLRWDFFYPLSVYPLDADADIFLVVDTERHARSIGCPGWRGEVGVSLLASFNGHTRNRLHSASVAVDAVDDVHAFITPPKHEAV